MASTRKQNQELLQILEDSAAEFGLEFSTYEVKNATGVCINGKSLPCVSWTQEVIAATIKNHFGYFFGPDTKTWPKVASAYYDRLKGLTVSKNPKPAKSKKPARGEVAILAMFMKQSLHHFGKLHPETSPTTPVVTYKQHRTYDPSQV